MIHVHALVHAVNSFPVRWQLESQLLSFVDNSESAMLEVGLTFEGFTDVIHLAQINLLNDCLIPLLGGGGGGGA